MKSILKITGITGVALIAVLFIAGCASVADKHADVDVMNWGIFGEAAAIPVKDYQTLGLVFTSHVFQPDEQSKAADVFTYQALLKEAEKLGADAVINVAIDRRRQYMRGYEGGGYRLETWYGSALAIKYTNVVAPGVPVNQAREPLTGSNKGAKRDH